MLDIALVITVHLVIIVFTVESSCKIAMWRSRSKPESLSVSR